MSRFSRNLEYLTGLPLFLAAGSRMVRGGGSGDRGVRNSTSSPLLPLLRLLTGVAALSSRSICLSLRRWAAAAASGSSPWSKPTGGRGVGWSGLMRPASATSRMLELRLSRLVRLSVPSACMRAWPPMKVDFLPVSTDDLDRGRVKRDLSQFFTLDVGEVDSSGDAAGRSSAARLLDCLCRICSLDGRWKRLLFLVSLASLVSLVATGMTVGVVFVWGAGWG